VKINVKEGSARAESLCVRCEHSMVLRTDGGDTQVYCTYYGDKTPVRAVVVQCSAYDPRGTMSRASMERIGWVLEIKDRKVIGFRQPKRSQWRSVDEFDEEVRGDD
jgi:hypothetical protein